MDIEALKSIITQAVENSAEKTVNGKIKKIDEKLEIHINDSKLFRDTVTKHIEASEKESKLLKPILERIPELTTVGQTVETANNIKKTAVWWAGFFAAIGTITAGVTYVGKTLFTAIILNIK